jgi:F0F1-type ATP synthase assembly protein I
MPDSLGPDQRELGRYIALGQVGMEMAAPVALGMVLDHYLQWAPWATVGGAVIGLIGGLSHLVVLTNRQPTDRRSSSSKERQP